MGYLPSELASATMMHVVKSVKPCLEGEYQRQLSGILGFDKVGGRLFQFGLVFDLEICTNKQ